MALSLGNSVHGNDPGNTVLSLTLSFSIGSIIIVDTTCNGAPVVSVVSTALGNFTHHASQPLGGFERWFLIPSSSQTNDTITITQTSSAFLTGDAYEVKGGDTVSPFDSGGPVTSNGPDPVSITTVNANTMVIAGFRENATAAPTAGATFTQISGADFQLTEYKILSSAQTLSCTQTTGATDSNGLILDAIKQAAASSIGKNPSTLLLPPNRHMVGWRGLRRLQAFPPSGLTISMSALAEIQVRAAAASTSQLTAAARSEIQIKARAASVGATAVTARAETMVKAAGALAGATAITGRTAVQIKSVAAPTMAAAIAGRATAMLKAAAAATGVVPLAGLATTMVKAAGGITTGSFVALAARAAIMVKSSAAATSQAALSARAATMTKASAAATGATAMAGQAAIMVKAAGAVTTGALVALSARCTVLVKAAAQQAQATVLAAHLTLQVKAQSPAPTPTPPAGQFQLITSMAGFFNPGSSAIP